MNLKNSSINSENEISADQNENKDLKIENLSENELIFEKKRDTSNQRSNIVLNDLSQAFT